MTPFIHHGFVTKIDPAGSKVLYSTYFGGTGGAEAREVACGKDGFVAVAGTAWSADFPSTPGTFDPTWQQGAAFAAAFDLCGGSWLPYGSGCPGSGGFTPQLNGSGCPSPGQEVTLELSGALGGSTAWLLFGVDDLSVPLGASCLLSIAPLLPVVVPLPLGGSGPGAGAIALTGNLPASLPPATVYLQTVVADPAPTLGASVSNALAMQIGY
jgi:hypothetical protein